MTGRQGDGEIGRPGAEKLGGGKLLIFRSQLLCAPAPRPFVSPSLSVDSPHKLDYLGDHPIHPESLEHGKFARS